MMEGRSIDRKSSIESEPRTLTMDQIHFAREAALYVLQTSSIEEATSIFTEGLEPVISAVGMKKCTFGINYENEELEYIEENSRLFGNSELRDVVTAPF